VKRGLLIWNVVVTVVALVLILGACTSNSQVTDLYNRLQTQAVTIQQLQNEVNTLKSYNQQLTVQIQAQNQNFQSQIDQIITIINAR
jgi:outer membrane biogenesis lipoprotein LolB